MKNHLIPVCLFMCWPVQTMDENLSREDIIHTSQSQTFLEDLRETAQKMCDAMQGEPHGHDERAEKEEERAAILSEDQVAHLWQMCEEQDYTALDAFITPKNLDAIFRFDDHNHTFLSYFINRGEEERAQALLTRGVSPHDLICSYSALNDPLSLVHQQPVSSVLGAAVFHTSISAKLLTDLLARSRPPDYYFLTISDGRDSLGRGSSITEAQNSLLERGSGATHLMNSLGLPIPKEKKEAILGYLSGQTTRDKFIQRALLMSGLSPKNAVPFLLSRGYFNELYPHIKALRKELIEEGVRASALLDIDAYYTGVRVGMLELDRLFNEPALIRELFEYAGEEIFPREQERALAPAARADKNCCSIS